MLKYRVTSETTLTLQHAAPSPQGRGATDILGKPHLEETGWEGAVLRAPWVRHPSPNAHSTCTELAVGLARGFIQSDYSSIKSPFNFPHKVARGVK